MPTKKQEFNLLIYKENKFYFSQKLGWITNILLAIVRKITEEMVYVTSKLNCATTNNATKTNFNLTD